MSDIQEQESQVAEAQAAQVGGNDEAESLRAQVELLKQNNDKLLSEKKNQAKSMEDLQRQMAELRQSQSQAKQSKLAEQGEWKQLYEDLQRTHQNEVSKNSELVKQLEDKEAAYKQQTIQQRAVAAMQQAGAINPEDAYRLYQDKIKLDEQGNCVVWDGGLAHNVNDFAANLKNPDSSRAYLFNGSGARGMSAVGTTSQGSGEANPYLTGNFMAVCELEASDPQRAAQLRAQAGK